MSEHVSGPGQGQGLDEVPNAMDVRHGESKVGKRNEEAAYFASKGARAAGRFNAPRLFNDSHGYLDPDSDSDSDSVEDEGFHLTRVGRAGSVSTISTYDRENICFVPRDRVMIRQD